MTRHRGSGFMLYNISIPEGWGPRPMEVTQGQGQRCNVFPVVMIARLSTISDKATTRWRLSELTTIAVVPNKNQSTAQRKDQASVRLSVS